MAAPNRAAVKTYLGTGSSWSDAEIDDALAAELAAQARVCRVPVPPVEGQEPEWPADLAEALKRRVARNLELRGLPLGIQTTVTEVGTGAIRVGFDYEIKRLEAPFRKVSVG